MGIIDALIISLTGILVVMIELGLLAIIVITLSKVVGRIDNLKETLEQGKKSLEEKKKPRTSKVVQEQAKKEVLSGEDEIAAVMVAVCEESGIPLEEIIFRSITEIK